MNLCNAIDNTYYSVLELDHDIPQTGNGRLVVTQLKRSHYSMIAKDTFRFGAAPSDPHRTNDMILCFPTIPTMSVGPAAKTIARPPLSQDHNLCYHLRLIWETLRHPFD